MPDPFSAGSTGAVATAVTDAHRRDWGLVLAATLRVVRDLDLAQDCAQEAYAAAVASWPGSGVPQSPTAWLITTAKRRAIDAVRRDRRLRSKLPLLVCDDPETVQDPRVAPDPDGAVQDERLRLIFLCAHPALAREAQVALTLRLVCGLSTADIAAGFLVPESTMAARITRAKRKIALAHIPLSVPSAELLPDRLAEVLDVVALVLATGHAAPTGPDALRVDLLDLADDLSATLQHLLPDQPEVSGLRATVLLTLARRATRADADGRILTLAEQDRSAWDRRLLDEAHTLITDAMAAGGSGRHVLQAAITSLQSRPPAYDNIDWTEIVELYDALLVAWPSPVVSLNRAVALSMRDGPVAALGIVEALEAAGQLDGYRYLHATKADLLTRLGRHAEAGAAYRRALELSHNDAERLIFLTRLSPESGSSAG